MAWYRFSMKTGIRKRLFPTGKSVLGVFLKPCDPVAGYPEEWKKPLLSKADDICDGFLTWFFKHKKSIGSPPEWFRNPFTSTLLQSPGKHWTELGDFDLNTGDIKILWEPSRFYWLTGLARAYRALGDHQYLETINDWLNDWSENNPPNIGPNWKCGQEASIRVFQLVNTAKILDQHHRASEELCLLIVAHLKRVAGNLGYAVAQENNHGTSEGAGLFIGGGFLLQNSKDPKVKSAAGDYLKKGRNLLEERVARLVSKEGSFSQHSVNYHRVLVDTISMAEYWRQQFGLEPFNRDFYKKSEKALTWLEQMTDPESGQTPNLGSNDGAMLMNIHGCDYTDFRPAIQFARVVFNRYCRFEAGPWDEPLFWLEQKSAGLPVKPIRKQTCNLDNRYQILSSNGAWAVVKLPGFPFRPAQNDTFHFDFWVDGKNIACDAGSYSYYEPEGEDYSSVEAHNTIQFNGYEPMPKISRFLYSNWIRPGKQYLIEQTDEVIHWRGEFTDFRGNVHSREVVAGSTVWEIHDRVQSTEKEIWLRWHLPFKKSGIRLRENRVICADFRIEFDPDVEIKLEEAQSSRYYLHAEACSAIVVKLPADKTVVTKWILSHE